jgi:hypothetical protein
MSSKMFSKSTLENNLTSCNNSSLHSHNSCTLESLSFSPHVFIMAPNNKKQSLLPLGFFNAPSLKTVKKHKKLDPKHRQDVLPSRAKIRVDRKAEARKKEEERKTEGAAGWRHYLEKQKYRHIDRIRADSLYQVFGDALTSSVHCVEINLEEHMAYPYFDTTSSDESSDE